MPMRLLMVMIFTASIALSNTVRGASAADAAEVDVLLARADSAVAEAQAEKQSARKLELLREAKELTEKAVMQRPEDPRVLFADLQITSAVVREIDLVSRLRLVKKVEATALALLKIAPDYQFAAADRVLAHLYLKAPSFISIGSKEKYALHVQAAFRRAPEYPENIQAMADYLRNEKEDPSAADALLAAKKSKASR